MGIKYLQLEPAAYPADPDWLAMSADERGCYHTLIVFLSSNNGKLENNTEKLQQLCNTTVEKFEIFWKKFAHKFPVKRGRITHKRVSRELAKARKMIKQKSLAGKASGKKRGTAVEQPLNDSPTAAELKKEGKEGKKGKVKKGKKKYLDFVFLTDAEYKKLVQRYGERPTAGLIKSLNIYIGQSGKKYKSHYYTLLGFARRDKLPELPTPETEKEREKKEAAAREKRKQEIRDEDGKYYREQTTEDLKAMLADPKDQRRITRGWLIKEILQSRGSTAVSNASRKD